MQNQISIFGSQGRIVIEVLGYENPSAKNEDDANWLATSLRVEAGPFSGSFRLAFTTHDLTTLLDQIQNALGALTGTVSFQNLEDDVSLNIRFDSRGGATVSGAAHPHLSQGVALHFQFDSDQSILRNTARELEATLRRFPVISV
jgi:hypothetical protein